MKAFDALKARWNQDADGVWLCLLVRNGPMARQLCADWREGRTYTAEVKEQRNKRSLDANAYAWALMSQMADALRTDKDSVYCAMLERYGQTFVVKVPNDQVAMFLRQYPYCAQHEKLPPEERAQYYRVWLGSSNYDSREMAVFIDGVVSECKEMGIETKTPAELAMLKEEWT